MVIDEYIYPVLLSGGSGTRLWPLSRSSYPKPFLSLESERTLYQQSLLRFQSSNSISFYAPLIITNHECKNIAQNQLEAIHCENYDIILEPEGKNTAAAILASAFTLNLQNPKGLIVVSPTDHLIEDTEVFHKAIAEGVKSAKDGNIVTFGVIPTRPETGFGYVEIQNIHDSSASKVVNFIEKPDTLLATKLFKSGKHFWNSGIYLFRACDILEAFSIHKPEMMKQVKQAIENGKKELEFFQLEQNAWSLIENISIDYAIMERISNRTVVPLSCSWNDLGDWGAVWQASATTPQGVVKSKNTVAIDCTDVLLRSEKGDLPIVGLGLNNIVAIATCDAVLVADKSRTQDVKQLAAQLQGNELSEPDISSIKHRTWGRIETLTNSQHLQVNQIFLKPGSFISLDGHEYQGENWVVISGHAKATIGNLQKLVGKGESIFIPRKTQHKLENISNNEELIIIEVKVGEHL